MKKLFYLIPLVLISCNKEPYEPNPIIMVVANGVVLEMRSVYIGYANTNMSSTEGYYFQFSDQSGEHVAEIKLGLGIQKNYTFHQSEWIPGYDEDVTLKNNLIGGAPYHVVDSLGLFYLNIDNNGIYKKGDFKGNLHKNSSPDIYIEGAFDYVVVSE